jgi:tetratricopeptide (TPR) repeat protein
LSLSEGLVSALRKFEGVSFIQTTAPISHGSSGGGLFDEQGRLIGITTFTVKDGQNLNFAIPTDLVVGLKGHPATVLHRTDAERNASQAMILSQVAQDAMESGDYQRALEAYRQLSSLMPDDPLVWSDVGELYLHLKQIDNALAACQKALRLGPDLADSWSCMGDVYASMRQLPQAEEALKKAVDLDPREGAQLVNLFSLGRVFAAEDKRGGVMDIYRKLKTLDQNYADRFYKLFVEPILDAPDH